MNPVRRPIAFSRVGKNRRGIVLVVVMVVVVMISLAGFSFVSSMSNENQEVHVRGEELQMENALLSAEEFLKQLLIRSPERESSSSSSSSSPSRTPVLDDEAMLRGVVVADDGPHSRVRFTVIAPRYDETGTAPWQYGMERESSKLDLQTIMDWEGKLPGSGRRALMTLPGMTESIADALLDWMDRDSTPRTSGAEAEYYASLNPPYAPRNGIPESLAELLLVKGVDRLAVFGKDANQNHRVDLDEQSSLTSAARDTSGERLIPWTELLTLYSGERNQTRAGRPRINLNLPNLSELQRQLESAFDRRLATYAVLYRQFGPAVGAGPAANVDTIKPVLTTPGRFLFRSPLDLLQSRVRVPGPAGGISIVASPLPNAAEQVDEVTGMLYDHLSVSGTPLIRGRVNINTAPAEVLRAIPGIDKALAEQIVTARTATTKGDLRHEEHPCWLLSEGLVNLNKMKELYPYLTVGGDVYRAQIVAFSEASRLSHRVEIVLDASHQPVRRVFRQDLQILKRPYSWDVLDTPGGVTTSEPGVTNATSARN